jgi:hypothetical protein
MLAGAATAPSSESARWELVALEPGHQLAREHGRLQPPGGVRQHGVTGGVPEGVDDLPEPADVHEHDRGVHLGRGGRGQRGPPGGLQPGPVEQPGQRVVGGLVLGGGVPPGVDQRGVQLGRDRTEHRLLAVAERHLGREAQPQDAERRGVRTDRPLDGRGRLHRGRLGTRTVEVDPVLVPAHQPAVDQLDLGPVGAEQPGGLRRGAGQHDPLVQVRQRPGGVQQALPGLPLLAPPQPPQVRLPQRQQQRGQHHEHPHVDPGDQQHDGRRREVAHVVEHGRQRRLPVDRGDGPVLGQGDGDDGRRVRDETEDERRHDDRAEVRDPVAVDRAVQDREQDDRAGGGDGVHGDVEHRLDGVALLHQRG